MATRHKVTLLKNDPLIQKILERLEMLEFCVRHGISSKEMEIFKNAADEMFPDENP